MKKIYLLLVAVVACLSVQAQTEVFYDDFNRASFTDGSTGGSPATTYGFSVATGGASIGTTLVSGSNYMANITSGTGTGANSRSFFVAPITSFASPFNTTLSSNGGLVTWTFNMRTNTAVTTGTPANNVMSGGVDLCSDAGANIFSGQPQGYAVMFNSSATGGVNLVRFNGAMNTPTTIITGTTTINKTNFMSVRVTYNPATNQWALYVRDDGATAFADPSTGVTTQQGATTVNATYVNQAMANYGVLYTNTNATTGKIMLFDNFRVTLTLPPCSGTPAPGNTVASAASVCIGSTVDLSLQTATSGSGVSYVWKSAPDVSGAPGTFNPIAGATNAAYTTSLTATTWYKCDVTCSGNTGTSTPVQVILGNCYQMVKGATLSATTCGTTLYDVGGQSGQYSNNEDNVYTFFPGATGTGSKVRVSFTAFGTEDGVDYLYVYNGNNTGVLQVAGSPFTGATVPGTFTSTATDGSLTFRFTSDFSIKDIGFEAVITNTNPTPITAQPAASTTVCTGTAVSLSLTAGGTNGYQWYDNNTTNSNSGGSAISGATNATYAPPTASAGTHYYYCVVTNACSVTFPSNTAGVFVNAKPTVASISPSSANLCLGTALTLTAGAVTGTGTLTSYNWTGPSSYNAATAGNSAVFTTTTTASSGNYSVTVTYPGTGCTSLPAVTSPAVTVNALPTVAGITASPGSLCAGASLTLTAGAVTGTGTPSYNWSGPNSYSATTLVNNAVFTPTSVASSGNYSLTVSYPGTGCTSTQAVTSTAVTVNVSPTVASITPSASNLCTGTPLTLTAGATTGTILYYNWTGPNGYSTTTAGNSAVFTPTATASSGDYSVTVTGPGCSSAAAVTTVTVNALPTVAGITPSSATLCVGTALTLTAGAVTGTGSLTSYNWTGPNSYSTTTAGNSAVFTATATASSGNYSVTVTYPGVGCTSSVVATVPSVTVNALPTVASITPSPASLCAGTALTLTAGAVTGTGTPSYNWSGPNSYSATTLVNSAVFSPASTASSGNYSVTVTYAGAGCTSSAAVTSTAVTVNVSPTVASITPSAANLCTGTALTLTAGATTGTILYYSWTGPNGYSTTTAGNSAVFTPTTTAASGDYSVTVAGPGCSSTAAVTTVTVNALPTVAGITPSATQLCSGTPLTLTAGATTGAGAITAYNWTGPNSYSTTTLVNSAVFTPTTVAASGAYSVAVSYAGAGCTSSVVATVPSVTVNAAPTVAGITPSSANLCAGTVLTLTAGATTGTGSLTSYNWTGPNGYSATTLVNSAVFTPTTTAASGDYSVTVTYTGTGCTSAAAVTTVTVNALPTVAIITPSSADLCVGTALTLTAGTVTGTGSLTSYNWTGPNSYSTTTTGNSAVFTATTTAASGDYSVTVTYTGTGCTSAAAVTAVTVNALPTVVSITPSSADLCAGTALTLTAGATSGTGSIVSYNWTGPNGYSVTTAVNSAVFTPTTAAASGAYSVTVSYAGTGCTSVAAVTTVTVNALPTVAGITPSAASLCVGTALTLTAGAVTGTGSIASYNWSGPNSYSSTTAGNSAVFTATTTAASGDYSVTVTYTGTGCTSAAAVTTVTVNALPTVAGITPSATELCAGTALTLTAGTATGTGAITAYNWSGPNSYSTTTLVNNATFTPTATAASGDYSVTVSYAGAGCTSTAVVTTVTVNAAPTVASITPSSANLCAGTLLTLTAGATTGTGSVIAYNWTGPNSYSTTTAGNSAAFTPTTTAASGNYSVTVTYTGTGCTSAAAITTITVNALPTVASITSSTALICTGTSLTLTAGATTGAGSISSYNWSGPNGYNTTTAVNAATFTPTTTVASGIYTLSVTYTGTGCTSTAVTSAVITVNNKPTVTSIGVSPTLLCANNPISLTGSGASGTGGILSYNWSGPAGYSSTTVAAAQTYTVPDASASGVYSLTVTYPGTGCTSNAVASAAVTVNPLPVAYTVTGGGSYCSGGTGVAIGLSNSEAGVNYQLYNGSSVVGSVTPGTGVALSFGMQTVAGTYSVHATNTGTGCANDMTGTTSVTISSVPSFYNVTGGGNYCAGTGGVAIGLDGSDPSVSYQLYNGASPVGALLPGTGSAVSFGTQTATGTYTVVANPGSACARTMTGSTTILIYPLPNVYNVTGGGTYCSADAGVHLGLDWSVVGINYQTYIGATAVGSAVPGSGVALDLGLRTVAGTYTVLATNSITHCISSMTGSATVSINPSPSQYGMTGGGTICAGSTVGIGLVNSNTGINYQLYNGATPVGSAVAGSGSSISFGAQGAAGTYTVLATDAVTMCTRPMTGSVDIIVNPAPTAYSVTGGGAYCTGGTSFAIGLANSDPGFTYQLYNGAATVGSALPGTGSALDFGVQAGAGTYTVLATNTISFCTGAMTGSAAIVVNTLPVAQTVTGGGHYCSGGAGAPVGLAASQSGVNYQLYNGATLMGSTIPGTGSAISFGSQTMAGTYTVVGTNATTTCVNNMLNGVTVTIDALPAVYNITGGGSYCLGDAGVVVGLDNSATGINYQLYNGASAVGSPVPGSTGNPISFGFETAAGTYSVIATNNTSLCTQNMAGTKTISINLPPSVFAVTGGGSYCAGDAGVHVTLNASETGINYQLYNGSTATGSVVPGTGSPLDLGLQTAAGTYSVLAINPITNCTSGMLGTTAVVINPLPTAYNVTGGGGYCIGGAGVHIGLDFSAPGVNYQLYNGAATVGAAMPGTGLSIDFGLQMTAGTYTVLATNSITTCHSTMTGSKVVVINPLPLVYNVTGGGHYCAGGTGVDISLDNSENGVNYQLYVGTSATGALVPGTGAAISFGLQTVAGTYTVQAINATTTCINNMAGSKAVTIDLLPVAYAMTGGGGYCAGGSGVNIGLLNSDNGITYQLYNGASATGTPVAGTGGAISFGSQTVAGTYTVLATNNTTGCTNAMTGNEPVIINALPTAFSMTGGGSYCAGGAGVTVGLGNSDIGISYRLYRGATAVGSAVAGNGSAISFGLQTVAGTYTVLATNTTTLCTKAMTGSVAVIMNALPNVYAVTGGGAFCAGGTGVHVGLNFGDVGIKYQLYNGATTVGAPVAGTGSGLDFGLEALNGTYSAVAINISTLCTVNMIGSVSVTVNALPDVYNVFGGGSYCAGGTGVHVYLDGSASGINYQLYNGSTPSGAPFAGHGSGFDFGLRTAAGTYTVLATNAATGCTRNMSSSAVVGINLLPNAYAVTGGGSYCPGGTGVAIGLANSNTGINYQLYVGSTPVGAVTPGTGSSLNFGLQTTAGTYSVSATDMFTGCSNNMTGSTTVSLYTLPTAYAVTGGGAYCNGASGVAVGVINTDFGVDYRLYRGATQVGTTISGIGGAISFGLQTVAGIYTVTATNAVTGCVAPMPGSAAVIVNTPPTAYAVGGGGTLCAGGIGFPITLSTSQTGVNYQLYRGSTPIGGVVAGTNTILNFGDQTTAGIYTVVATNATTACTSNMTGSATIVVNPLPLVFSVSGGGSYCAGGTGLAVGLSGSENGVNYKLYNGVTLFGGPTAGTGSSFNFGIYTAAGTYTVSAINATTGCSNNMTGSTAISINPLPVAYNVTGGGSYCAGGTGPVVGLAFTVPNVNYQLYHDGIPSGSAMPGTGGGISFGPQVAAGTYTVIATNTTTSCTNNMAGNAVVSINVLPTVYALTGGGSYCTGGSGVDITLGGSDAGINYQLYNGASAIGTTVPGTGGSVSFGLQTAAGTYTVKATNATTGCTNNMAASVLVNPYPAPTAYAVTGGGTYCSGGTGVAIGLINSDVNTTYRLYNDATAVSGVVAGTGSSLNFGLQTTTGTYTVLATNQVTGCTGGMAGSASVNINAAPTLYSIAGGGGYCAGSSGVDISTTGSDVGVTYQLYNGATPVGTTAAGTGSPIHFGLQTTAGTYSVLATHGTTGCALAITGSTTVSVNPLPFVHMVIGGGSYCAGGAGQIVVLTGSNTGISYQLYNNGSIVGSPVAGSTGAFSFGSQTAAGTYTVLATDGATGCTNAMSGSASISINPLPVAYTMTGGGAYCAGGTGVPVGLGNSATGISYRLYRNGTQVGSALAGIGGAMSFGLQTAAGTYTIQATNTTTGCVNNMTGSATVSINPLPASHNVTGGGSYCTGGAGVTISLDGSDAGMTYQLYNDATAIGSAIPGTGGTIDFGVQSTAGVYTVVATNTTTGCTAVMAGDASVVINTPPLMYAMTGGGSYCAGGAGVHIGVSGSQTGVTYKLYNGAALVSTTVGTGAALDLGARTAGGTYTVLATNTFTGCTTNISGSAVVTVNGQPVAYAVSPGGSYCAGGSGVDLTLNSSEVGVNYQIYNGASVVGTVAGTGTLLDLGLQTAAGTYTVLAINAATGCTNNMLGTGSVSINPLPTVYTMTGGGNYCPGAAGISIGLSGSEVGTDYQLYNGSSIAGAPVSGTGNALDLGIQSAIGVYTIVATTAATTCMSDMTGTATVGINSLPTAYTLTGGGNYCAGGTGIAVGLDGSQSNTTYQLYLDGTATGSAVAGTGLAISFGQQTAAGTYTVMAANTITTCVNDMNGDADVTINALPVVHTMTGGGGYCIGGTGVSVGLDGSEAGVSYQLYYGNTAVGSAVPGNGGTLGLGLHTDAGTYTVSATNNTTGCMSDMTGSAIVTTNALPAAYNVTSSASSYCIGGAGVQLGLDGSESGVTYQLYQDGIASGAAVAGTGGNITFGMRTAAGNYTVMATNATTSCVNTMTGGATVAINALPVVYTTTGGGNYCAGGAGMPVALDGSETGVSYQLYNGTDPVGAAIAGTGVALYFGLQTTSGTYTIAAVNDATACGSNMAGDATVHMLALPDVQNVTGGGNYCAGGAGMHVSLSSSASGVNYQLYNGSTPVGSVVAGTGATLDLGARTAAGTYSVLAIGAATGCVRNMTGSATIAIDPLPSVYAMTGGGAYCNGTGGVPVGLAGSATGISYRLYNGSTPVGGAVPGTGAALNFGAQTSAGTYTVIAANTATACTSNMTGGATVIVNALPTVFSVTGGGSYCAGSAGVNIGISSSSAGISYQLSNGTTLMTTLSGTGGVLYFGPQTVAGAYTVHAVDAVTGCARDMSGNATVAITPTVIPTISLGSSNGDTVCAGNVSIFTAITTNGGSAPVYQWKVNGGNVGTGITSYNYIPANGDVVSITVTSNATCAVPAVTSASLTMVVNANHTPAVTIAVSPNDTVCKGTAVTLAATPEFGGATPAYVWLKNGSNAGTGSTLTYIPDNGDVVMCMMTSSYQCRTISTVPSGNIKLAVVEADVPSVTITADPGTSISPSQTVTFTANVTNGGAAPTYQWLINGSQVPGATGHELIRSNLQNNDSVTCQVTSHGPCGDLASFNTVTMSVSNVGVVHVASASIDVRVLPNPNNGTFTIKGSFAANGNEEVTIEVLDMLGQNVYRNSVITHNGNIEEHISLDNTLANGMYMLNLRTAKESKVFHIMLQH